MELRLHLDENVHGAVADALRRRGIDVSTAHDAGLIGASDEEHLAFALGGARVIVTHDADFLRMHAQGTDHPGIAFCHAGSRSIREIVRALHALHLLRTTEEMRGCIEFL